MRASAAFLCFASCGSPAPDVLFHVERELGTETIAILVCEDTPSLDCSDELSVFAESDATRADIGVFVEPTFGSAVLKVIFQAGGGGTNEARCDATRIARDRMPLSIAVSISNNGAPALDCIASGRCDALVDCGGPT